MDPQLFEPATEAEKAQQVQMRESVSFMKDALRRLSRNRMAMICLILIVVIGLVAFIVPTFYPYSYTKQDVAAKYLQPF